jgi:hypothetical protein
MVLDAIRHAGVELNRNIDSESIQPYCRNRTVVGCDAISGTLPAAAGLNGDCSPGFVETIDGNDSAAVRDLAARGAIVSCPRSSERLAGAITQHQISQLSLLLEAGVDPNYGSLDDRSRSMRAMVEERTRGRRGLEAAELLLEHGAKPDQRGTYWMGGDVYLGNATPLIAATAVSDIEFATLLMRFEPQRSRGRADLFRPCRSIVPILNGSRRVVICGH